MVLSLSLSLSPQKRHVGQTSVSRAITFLGTAQHHISEYHTTTAIRHVSTGGTRWHSEAHIGAQPAQKTATRLRDTTAATAPQEKQDHLRSIQDHDDDYNNNRDDNRHLSQGQR